MTATTKASFRDGGTAWEITLFLPPVPASRPRVSRWGTYYPKTYATWKAAAEEALRRLKGLPETLDEPVYVAVEHVVKRPQKPVRDYPSPDLDNYDKAIFDAITKAGLLWEDDRHITLSLSRKRYAEEGEEPHTFLRAALSADVLMGLRKGEDVYDLPAYRRISLDEL